MPLSLGRRYLGQTIRGLSLQQAMTLETLLALIRDLWPARYHRGRIQQVYYTHTEPDGSTYRIAVTIQQLIETSRPEIESCSLE